MSARDHLFLQVLNDIKNLLRLNLRLAGGESAIQQERDELANALQIKRALLMGMEAAGGPE